jgi:indole-3-glycerol phosphate synthase
MNILETILENTRQEVSLAKKSVPIERLKELPGFTRQPLSLQKALRRRDITVIAEIKKASPSRGLIREDFEPVSIAKEFVNGGASALSVLTDKKFFQGNIRFIADVRSIVPIPILRKDFIIDSYQLTEAKVFGADAVLLIAAALEPEQLRDLHSEADKLRMDCLVEVHSERELETLDLDQVKIIGINNRSLMDFSVDLSTTIRVASIIPKGMTIVSESGISNRSDLEYLHKNGIHAVLVGEHLMRAKNPREELRVLLTPAQEQF